tara:strand:+ start:2820 stop:3479 length:660 start_codon:yes stop_codon:yes gene_type:complete
MRLSHFALTLLLPLCAACATAAEKEDFVTPLIEAQKSLKPTVESYEAMNFALLSNPSSTELDIKAGDPTFDFGENGVSYFRAIELPVTETSYQFTVSNVNILYGCYPCHRGNFLAEIQFLDASKKPINETDRQRYWGTIDNQYTRFITASVRPTMKARYAVIHTTQKALMDGEGGSMNTGSGVAPVGSLFIPVPAPHVDTNGVPVGRIKITIGDTPKNS